MKVNQIITIGRQFGAGGRRIGKALADRLEIPFYDKELIAEACKASGLPEQMLLNMDEQNTTSLLYSLVMQAQTKNIFGNGKSMELMAYEAQIASVKLVAKKGACVIVGRAADCILKDDYDITSFFISSPLEKRISHVSERDNITPNEAKKKLVLLDKNRATFYNSFSDKRWGTAESYDLCVNLGEISEEQAVEIILKYIEIR